MITHSEEPIIACMAKQPHPLTTFILEKATWKRPSLWWLAFAFWCALTLSLSSLQGEDLPLSTITIPHLDKIVHFTLFGIGAFVFSLTLRLSFRWKWPVIIVLTVTSISFLGGLDELYQLMTPGRSGCDIGDWLADSSGAIAGSTLLASAANIYLVYERTLIASCARALESFGSAMKG